MLDEMRMVKKKIKSIHAHIFRMKQRNEYVNGPDYRAEQRFCYCSWRRWVVDDDAGNGSWLKYFHMVAGKTVNYHLASNAI